MIVVMSNVLEVRLTVVVWVASLFLVGAVVVNDRSVVHVDVLVVDHWGGVVSVMVDGFVMDGLVVDWSSVMGIVMDGLVVDSFVMDWGNMVGVVMSVVVDGFVMDHWGNVMSIVVNIVVGIVMGIVMHIVADIVMHIVMDSLVMHWSDVMGVVVHGLVVDWGNMVGVMVDSLVVHWSSVVYVMVDGLMMDSLVVDWGCVVSIVMDSLVVDWGNMVGVVMGGFVVHWSGVMSLSDVVLVVVYRLLMVDDFVVFGVMTNVTIVVVHLEDEASILNIDLAAHEERRVVLEAPVVTGVPFLGVPVVKVVSPAELEVFLVLVVVVNLDKVVFGEPRHSLVIKVVVPWGPGRSPEVHPQLS